MDADADADVDVDLDADEEINGKYISKKNIMQHNINQMTYNTKCY